MLEELGIAVKLQTVTDETELNVEVEVIAPDGTVLHRMANIRKLAKKGMALDSHVPVAVEAARAFFAEHYNMVFPEVIVAKENAENVAPREGGFLASAVEKKMSFLEEAAPAQQAAPPATSAASSYVFSLDEDF